MVGWQLNLRTIMAAKLYVGGLPYSTTNEELEAGFAKAGNVVSATVIFDKMSGRSKGFGFVEMSSEDEANAASGRNISVSEARPMTPRENNNRY